MNNFNFKETKESFLKELALASNLQQLYDLKSKYLGKKGLIQQAFSSISKVNKEDRKEFGKNLNLLKEEIEEKIKKKISNLEYEQINYKLKDKAVDPTLYEYNFYTFNYSGSFHPTFLVKRKIEQVFISMGFEVLDGPYIEDERHNFSALNIPEDHPARDMQDTLWFQDNIHLFRTHTSPIQIRGMERGKIPPFRFIAPGKVFRNERTDASHEIVFHQIEGLLVDKDISIAHLLYFAGELFEKTFNKKIKLRTRPSYFPFVEPGIEIDISCILCNQKGCSACSKSGWLEMMGAGLVHPNVLSNCGINSQEWTGFAFGLGLDRLAMMLYGINDVRLFHSGDLRFLSQWRVS